MTDTAGKRFHLWMAGVFAVIAFAGFTPSYWAKVASGTFTAAPIYHIHGLLLFSWFCFYFAQTALVASGRTMNHRTWGMAGIALFSVMLCSTAALEINSMNAADHAGFGDAGRRFAVVTFTTIALLMVLFAAAIANVRRPDVHKRLMLLVMVVLVQPAVARMFALLFATPGAHGPPPLMATLPVAFVADILIIVAIVHEWRTRGRPHDVYLYGGLFVLAFQVLKIPFASSAAWMAFAGALQHLMG
jgi:hypothetical protein